MHTQKLIYFCTENNPWTGSMYPWFIVNHKATAFCPFLKPWERCFCIIDQKDQDMAVLTEYYNNWDRELIRKLIAQSYEIDEKDVDENMVNDYLLKNFNLDESLSYKYAINLWKLDKITVSHRYGVKVELIDKKWNKNILDLWESDDYEIEKIWSDFLSLLLSCKELWDISAKFWKWAVAQLPWLAYAHVPKWKDEETWERIYKMEPDMKPSSPCDELHMYSDWKEVKKLSRTELQELYWIKVDKINNVKVEDWWISPKIELLEKKGLNVTYPDAGIYYD